MIITPHFPPSNLAAVHRSRLFARHLASFGWEPVILTVHERHYEEKPDWELMKLVPSSLKIYKVDAFRLSKPRLIGDLGLRAFIQLYKAAKEIIRKEQVNFLYIPIPSFYTALLGRWLHARTGIKYGIDYIDPWVHVFPGSEKVFSRHWFSTRLARFLEPIAIKKASIITGVAEGYYKGVIERNPHLLKHAILGAMPYGGEETDYTCMSRINREPYLFKKKPGKILVVYAGAMLPKAYQPLEQIFKAIKVNVKTFQDVEFHFIGTGKIVNNSEVYAIKSLAQQYGLWDTVVFEYPKRIPYLDVLIHLKIADSVFILGSTESHYTPSKTYQGVLAGKPLLAVLHCDSTAVKIIEKSNAGLVLAFDGENGLGIIEKGFNSFFIEFLNFINQFSVQEIDLNVFEKYSAHSVTKQLANLLDYASYRAND